VSRALLQGVAEGRLPASLRIYQPDDVLAFSILDRTAEGFESATRIAGEQGFAPVLRLAGGRAAVFHSGTLAFAWSRPVAQLQDGIEARYAEMGAILVEALKSLGADARLGEIPGEYCPGRFSVNAGGLLKLAGIGQRVVRGAAHVGGVIVVSGADRVKGVLTPIYRALAEPFVPETTGAVDDVLPKVKLGAVAAALRAAFEARYEIDSGEVDAETLARAETLAPEHLPAHRASGKAASPLHGAPKGVMESS
jgi:lipoate-protein ligase A